MIYQHPLAYLLGMEGLALLRAWAGDADYDQAFVRARFAEVRALLADEELVGHPGVEVGRDATATAYRQWSATYDDPGNGLFDLDGPLLAEITAALSTCTAVDAGCGTGRVTAELVAQGHRVIGVDGSTAMLEQARRRLPDTVLLAGELEALPVSSGAVDLVVTALALTHVPDLVPVFAEIARVLRPGGHLVISDVHPGLVFLGSVVKGAGPAGEPQQATTHRHSTADFLRAALACGFEVRRYEEEPRLDSSPPGQLPEATTTIGDWSDWPWTLLDRVPRATRAAWHTPAVLVWHLQLGSRQVRDGSGPGEPDR